MALPVYVLQRVQRLARPLVAILHTAVCLLGSARGSLATWRSCYAAAGDTGNACSTNAPRLSKLRGFERRFAEPHA